MPALEEVYSVIPENFGFDARKINRAERVLQRHVSMRTTPGAVGIAVCRKGVVACWAVGRHTYQTDAAPVQVHTLYDLASVTKVVATTTLCMLFADEGRLDLAAPVQSYLPDFVGKNKDRVTVRHLLAHCSGLPAHVHLYKRERGEGRGKRGEVRGEKQDTRGEFSHKRHKRHKRQAIGVGAMPPCSAEETRGKRQEARGKRQEGRGKRQEGKGERSVWAARQREAMVDAACRLPLVYEPGTGTAYSDMGFLVLGKVLETVGEGRLDVLAKQRVFEPLAMRDTLYCPPPDLLHRIPPTERGTHLRDGLVHGEVHDENAAAMGGIASHAGLFSTAGDLAKFLRAWLGAGIFPERGIRQFTTRANIAPKSTWALGWDTVSPGISSSGRHFSERAFGSLGFTGTSIWADPIRDLGVVLLTNRVHPTRENAQIKHLRPEFHDAISEARIE